MSREVIEGAIEGAEVEAEAPRLNTESNIEVAKPQTFNKEIGKIFRFLTAYKLYIRIRMRNVTLEEQIQLVLSWMQGGSADTWKENVLEDLEARILEYITAGKFLADLKR